jgi:type IV secretory pathway VirJ component
MRGVQTSLAKAAGLLLVTWGGAAAAPTQVFDYGRFGEISMYRGDTAPRDVVLFLSGDGGWNLGVISMARRLLDKGAVVAGIDIRHYLQELEKSTDECDGFFKGALSIGFCPDLDLKKPRHRGAAPTAC